jgi:5-methylcytosine-specific restriction protein A
MLLEYFKQYMKITRGITDKSVGHYITGLNTINGLLKKYGFRLENVFDANEISDLDAVFCFLQNNEEFQTKDSVGHNMYSVAFGHFYRFAKEDPAFFGEKIESLDMIVSKPSQITTSSTTWKRNQILISQAIEGANYLCEHNPKHITFTSKATGKAYMEGHHLIALKYQPEFSCGIDVYANIVCLCPICHRLLHFGTDSEKSHVAEEIFEKRHDRLKNSGIDLSKGDFLKLVV